MQSQPIRVFKAVTSRKYAQVLAGVAPRRALSTSAVCLEEGNTTPSEPERSKGVPLAHELGGVRIENQRKRVSLGQRLARRSGITVDAPKSAVKFKPLERRAPRDARASPRKSNDGHGGRGRSRSPSRDQQRRPSHATPRTSQVKRPQRPSQPRSAQQPGSDQQSRSGHARAAGRGPRGQQRDGGERSQASASRTRQARSSEETTSAPKRSARTADPELNDYPNEVRNPPPVRRYDDNGILQLKGRHEQINPVIPPSLPKLPTPAVIAGAATTSNTLRVLSYLDRVPHVPIAHASNGLAGIVDDASRALSRVRELDMPQRRDALSIVERMAKTAAELDKGAGPTA